MVILNHIYISRRIYSNTIYIYELSISFSFWTPHCDEWTVAVEFLDTATVISHISSHHIEYNDKQLTPLDFCKNDGKEVYDILTSLGYKISDENKLIGKAIGTKVKDTIYDFFDNKRDKPDDTLLFYYSGHGVPDVDGDMYLASSDTDPDKPYRKGFSFEELTKMIQKSISTRVAPV